MLTKTKIALAAVLIFGTASGALARGSYGGPNQTWQDIARDRQDIQNQIRHFYHTDNPGNAYGYVPSPNHTKHRR
jgi:hypothetical protein